jgi:predicted molibdopterin-dependent oxidoreductase YjgC
MNSHRFRALAEGPTVRITFDGIPLEVPIGTSVAAALLAAGVHHTRTTSVSGGPRAPYCMMGVCFDCLVEIDNRANRLACLTPVAEGMQVRTQEGARALASVNDGCRDVE